MIFGILSVIVGSLNNLNQKKIKKILGLSSLFSLG
jgi:formate hydrogenlyase subunit 3/multisubunit Na+/H+ antiporter MnhD subunit